MEVGRVFNREGSRVKMSRTFAPGKHRVTALKKRMFLIMESPTIKVVGGKSGRGVRPARGGEVDRGDFSRGDRGGEVEVTRANRGAGVKHGIDRRDPVRRRCGTASGLG